MRPIICVLDYLALICVFVPQSRWVVVSDTKAMHSIFIKDQDTYPEPF